MAVAIPGLPTAVGTNYKHVVPVVFDSSGFAPPVSVVSPVGVAGYQTGDFVTLFPLLVLDDGNGMGVPQVDLRQNVPTVDSLFTVGTRRLDSPTPIGAHLRGGASPMLLSGPAEGIDTVTLPGSPTGQFAFGLGDQFGRAYVNPTSQAVQTTFTTATAGTLQNVFAAPVKWFSIQVNATGAVTSWTVVIEGGLDGTTFTTILTHTNATGSGIAVAAANSFPVRYFRLRCTAIVLGAGTNVVARALGTA